MKTPTTTQVTETDRAHRALADIEHDLAVINQLQAELRCELVRFYAGQLDTPKEGSHEQ